jgi:hypothetical protein
MRRHLVGMAVVCVLPPRVTYSSDCVAGTGLEALQSANLADADAGAP